MGKDSATLPIRDEEGESRGTLVVETLQDRAKMGGRAVLETADEAGLEADAEPEVKLLEGAEYVYEFCGLDSDRVEVDKREIFSPDDDCGIRGRLRPGLHTGTMTVTVSADGARLGDVVFEVRSVKLDYRKDYQQMLNRLADGMAEVVMQRFAPSEQQFQLDAERDAETLYQRFAFLKSRLFNESFQSSLERIFRHPYSSWERITESKRPGRGGRASSDVVRQFSKPGPRVEWTDGPDHAPDTLPREIESTRTVSTVDNTPNRFVRYCLKRWRGVLARLRDGLASTGDSTPIRRGIREVDAALDRLDALLARPLFREVGDLDRFPAGNQVLQKRPGYRDVFEAYIQFELAARLSWSGGRDVYGAGQRDVATLYEFWVFFEVAKIFSNLCDEPFDFSELLKADEDGLGIQLKKGHTKLLEGFVERRARKFRVEVSFNKTFSNNDSQTWTRNMRPDVSAHLQTVDDRADHRDVWLHFDAKYRVKRLTEAFGEESERVDEETEVTTPDGRTVGAAKRSDILKMHAYRDAIRRSSGAYIIYPGVHATRNEVETFEEYHEILPGLGAFPLRPASSGDPAGSSALAELLDDLLNHLADRTTEDERGRYWTDEAYNETEQADPQPTPAVDLPERPAADTTLLLVHTRSTAEYEWTVEHGAVFALDTLDGTDRTALAADYVIVSGPNDAVAIGEPTASLEFLSANQLAEREYPGSTHQPMLHLTFDLVTEPNLRGLQNVQSADVRVLRRRVAPDAQFEEPVTASLYRLLGVQSGHTA